VSRWEPNARERLQQAALELYHEQGFEQTTVAEVAARAGLTERTFFRHFRDKREVLFAGSETLEREVVRAIDEAPRGRSAIDAVAAALSEVAAKMPVRQAYARRRHDVIAASPELAERERIKLASLATGIAGALQRRGVGERAAAIAAELGVAAFRIAFERWVTTDESREISDLVRQAFGDLKAVSTGAL
jgi:AcrR family transcriptional regulator